MATNIEAGVKGVDWKRVDSFCVNPFEIQVSEELRGRRFPPTEEEIVAMACSLLDDTQLQPVNARRGPGNKLILTLGFTRTAAARLIREGFTDPDGNHRQDAEFLLKVAVADCNDQEAFTRNVVENRRRNQTSPIDDAHNQNTMRERYGMTDADIARKYGENASARVCRIKGLLRLPNEAQLLVHSGELSVDAALTMLTVPEGDQKVVVEKARNGEKVTGAEVKRQVREHHLRDEPLDDSTEDISPTPMAAKTAAPKLPLSIKEVRTFFETLAEATDSVEDKTWIPAVQKFAKEVGQWLAGKRSDKAVCKSLNRLLAGTPEAERE